MKPQGFHIAAKGNTPEIILDLERQTLFITGDSFPTDAAAFYLKVMDQLKRALKQHQPVFLKVNIQLGQVNSASIKYIMFLMGILESFCGQHCEVCWIITPGDEAMLEMGEDLGDEVAFPFHVLEIADIPLRPAS